MFWQDFSKEELAEYLVLADEAARTSVDIQVPADEMRRLVGLIEEYQTMFTTFWRAQQRAVNLWASNNPGKKLPKHDELIVWLLNNQKEANVDKR